MRLLQCSGGNVIADGFHLFSFKAVACNMRAPSLVLPIIKGLPIKKRLTHKKTPADGVLKSWSGKRDSNSRPQPWQGCALPTELFPLKRGIIGRVCFSVKINRSEQVEFQLLPGLDSDRIAIRVRLDRGRWYFVAAIS